MFHQRGWPWWSSSYRAPYRGSIQFWIDLPDGDGRRTVLVSIALSRVLGCVVGLSFRIEQASLRQP